MQSTGTTVNTAVVIACGKGILMHKDPALLTSQSLQRLGTVPAAKNGLS